MGQSRLSGGRRLEGRKVVHREGLRRVRRIPFLGLVQEDATGGTRGGSPHDDLVVDVRGGGGLELVPVRGLVGETVEPLHGVSRPAPVESTTGAVGRGVVRLGVATGDRLGAFEALAHVERGGGIPVLRG